MGSPMDEVHQATPALNSMVAMAQALNTHSADSKTRAAWAGNNFPKVYIPAALQMYISKVREHVGLAKIFLTGSQVSVLYDLKRRR